MNNPTSTSANNNTPVQLGHYQLRDCIGRGGMGLVYRARDTRLERDVAIKCLRTELFESHYIERFKREALLLAKLNHPNIVQIYDFIEAPEQVALVMELVDGQNLQTYLREHIVPISQRLQWLIQISEGLAIAHDAGIIHRDLKTENILINKRGQAKITDLGIAKSQDFNVTLTDHVAGSYCSMSPEQAMGEAITFKSDLFSLGILAYQLLCGAHPFGDTSNKLQTMQRIISHPPTSPQQHNPDLPTEFIELLGQLLSKDPDKRPDNTHWVAAQFAKLRELNWQDDSPCDETQAMEIPLPVYTKAVRTQDHPTFDTHFVAITEPELNFSQKFKRFISLNKISIGAGTLSIFIIVAAATWTMQSKPPKYIAIIEPRITSIDMQETQQDIIKEAVTDALQQGVIQLNGYYLIPQNEVTDIHDNIDAIRQATAADELLTANINCKHDACSISINQLTSDNDTISGRLRVNKTVTIDVLTDDYLSLAQMIKQNVNAIYSQSSDPAILADNSQSYEEFLQLKKKYRDRGSSIDLLQKLEQLIKTTENKSIYAELYRELSLDLHFETNNTIYLENFEQYLSKERNAIPKEIYLPNKFQLAIAQKKIPEAKKIANEIISIKNDHSVFNELIGYTQMAERDFEGAIISYSKAIKARRTAENLYYMANAYWYSGNTSKAKELLEKSTNLAPNHFRSNSLKGLIFLYEGKIEDAQQIFYKLIRQRPEDVSNLNNLGLCYLLGNQAAKAIPIFNRAYELAPQNTTYLLNQGDAENIANTPNAEKIYRKIIEITSASSQNPIEYRNLAQAYAHLGYFHEAFKTLQHLEKIDPQNIDTAYTSSLVHSLANNITAAVFHAENTIKNGMNPIWFNFPWFKRLCSEQKFFDLVNKNKEGNICPP